METYSLNSVDFKNIETNLNSYLNEFYRQRRQIPAEIDKARSLLNFKQKFNENIKSFVHEYDMGFLENDGDFKITAELSASLQEYVIYLSKFQCSLSKTLKPGYTIQGKNAEAMCILVFNNWLNYFRINNKITLNTKSLRYGGDGGYDFSLGKLRFDVKHRDDGPSHGLILRDHYLNSAKDDVILLFVTNTTNIKLGSKFNAEMSALNFASTSKYLQGQELPMAFVGWMTVGEYKNKKKPRDGEGEEKAGIWVVDKLRPITDLLITVIEEQICTENLFV